MMNTMLGCCEDGASPVVADGFAKAKMPGAIEAQCTQTLLHDRSQHRNSLKQDLIWWHIFQSKAARTAR